MIAREAKTSLLDRKLMLPPLHTAGPPIPADLAVHFAYRWCARPVFQGADDRESQGEGRGLAVLNGPFRPSRYLRSWAHKGASSPGHLVSLSLAAIEGCSGGTLRCWRSACCFHRTICLHRMPHIEPQSTQKARDVGLTMMTIRSDLQTGQLRCWVTRFLLSR